MANTETTAPKRRIWLWGILAMMLTLLAAFLIQLFGPNPRIIVSKETTVITAPLSADGLPDYQKYWYELGREGVTHENNGAVLFWQAIWPGELSQEDLLPMAEVLGFEKIPDSTNTLQPPYSQVVRQLVGHWLTETYQKGLSPEASDELLSPEYQNLIANKADEIVGRAMSRPWTSEQVPPLADWVARNEQPLDLLIEASERPKWWSPSPSLLEDRYVGAIWMLLPGVQSMRGAGRALCLRAMWHAGKGRPTEAWNDLQSCFQLARFCGQGITLVEQLVAIAIDGLALQRTVALLQHGEPDAKFALQVLDDLNALSRPSDVVRSFDEGERIIFADTAIMIARDSRQLGGLTMGSSDLQLGAFGILRIDWNVILRDGNRWYDRLIETARKPTRAERMAAYVIFEDELSQLGSLSKNPLRFVAGFFSTRERSALISDVMVSLLLPALDAAMGAEDRGVVVLDLTRIATALAVYRAEQGEYPEQLAQLVPGVLAKVPDDLYSGKPFLYERKSDGGYLLYSVYENGIDDGGTDLGGEIVDGEWLAEASEDVDYSQSDIVIRVPMPKFELPTKPEFVE